MLEAKFWEHKSLEQMNKQEWEAICDGCAKCCLLKFIDEEEEGQAGQQYVQLHYSKIVCHLLDTKKCSCTQYQQRSTLVPDCVTLTKDNLAEIDFMPPSCSYRRLQEGRGLPSWHPLLNKGKKSKMHTLGMSVRGKTVSDSQVDLQDFEDYIVIWPLQDLD